MNIESKLEKLINIMQTENIDRIPEILKTLETYYNTPVTDVLCAIVPKQANFQLPNIFLRTKMMPECEKFLSKHNGNASKIKFMEIMKILEGVEIESEDFSSAGDLNECDMEFVRKCIDERY